MNTGLSLFGALLMIAMMVAIVRPLSGWSGS